MRVVVQLARRRRWPSLRLPRKAPKKTSYAKGQELEQRVTRLFQELGWRYVQSNVRVKDGRGHWSELDVVVGRWLPIYVECKNFEKPIPLEEVAKFKEVLRLNRIGLWRGLFVASGGFSPRATHTGVRTWDGEQLARMERIASVVFLLRRSWRWIVRLLFTTTFFFCFVFPWMMRVKAFRDRIVEWDPTGRMATISYRVRQLCRSWADRVVDTESVNERWERVRAAIKNRTAVIGKGKRKDVDDAVVEEADDTPQESAVTRTWQSLKDKATFWRSKRDGDDDKNE